MRRCLDLNHLTGVHLIFIYGLSLLETAEAGTCSNVEHTLKTSTGNTCYYVTSSQLTWSRSQRDCKSQGGHLAVLDNDDKITSAKDLMTTGGITDLWIGAIKQQMTETTWENGKKLKDPLNSYPWANVNSFIVDRGSGDDCVYVNNQKQWKNHPCHASKSSICQFDTKNAECSTATGREAIMVGSTCYLLEYGAVTWFQARERCISLGAGMARAENLTQFNLLVSKIVSSSSYGQQDLWVGLTRNKWTWVTGEEVIQTFWGAMQPSAPSLCVALHKYSQDEFRWQTASCARQMKYICQKDLTDGIGVVTPNQTPNADKSGLHGGLIFLLILLALVLVGIVAFMAFYIRRGRAVKKRAREHAREHNARESSRPSANPDPTNYTIFSCGVQQPNTAALSPGYRQGQLPPLVGNSNGHLKSNGHKYRAADEKCLLQNNNVPKVPKLNLESETSRKRHVSKSASKYKDVVNDSYDFEVDDLPESSTDYSEKNSDREAVFRDINNFRPDGKGSFKGEPVKTSVRTPKSKRDMTLYQSSDVFTVRNSLRIPLPTGTEESLVMESIQADEFASNDYENTAARDGLNENVNKSSDETDRSRYIEDVARAFDFLVSRDGSALGTSVSYPKVSEGHFDDNMLPKRTERRGSIQSDSGIVSESADGESPNKDTRKERRKHKDSPRERLRSASGRHSMRDRMKENKERENMKEKIRSRSESFRERKRNHISYGSDTGNKETSSKPLKKLHGEKEGDGTLRHRKKKGEGYVNGAFTGTDSEMDEESSRRKHKRRHRREYTEEELAERHHRKKERERKKKEGNDQKYLPLEELGLPDSQDPSLTRVGSPMPMGKLPPLVPHSEEKKKRHKHHKEHRSSANKEHRKHRTDMTEEEKEERRRRHKRKREKERRRRERAMRENKPEAKRIQVETGTEGETEEDDASNISALSSGEEWEGGSAMGTPKSAGSSTPGKGSRSGRVRRSSGQAFYDIDSMGTGEGIDV